MFGKNTFNIGIIPDFSPVCKQKGGRLAHFPANCYNGENTLREVDLAMKYGFIGTGNMGGALAQAVCRAVPPEEVLLCNRTEEKALRLARALGCHTGTAEAAARCRYVFLGVKPQGMAELLAGLRPVLEENREVVLVSMAAGISMAQLCQLAGREVPVMRLMPNTPVACGQGVVLWCGNALLSAEDRAALTSVLAGAGLVEELREELMDAGSALCGCSPAFTDLYLESLADGAVACGIPHAQALRLAAAAVQGAAALALESGEHPAVLKNRVCSPAGSTIQGVRTLEARGFRSAVFEALLAAAGASGSLGK